MKIFLFFFLVFIISPFFLQKILTSPKNSHTSFITVINLIRGKDLGHEKDNLYTSLKDQWKVTSDRKINATWLWQYGALGDGKMTNFATKTMKNQEFGILLEIDRNYARESGVSYRGQGPTYFSDGLLLVSYDKEERRKLIDTVFKKFKKVFGYYPKTIGAWWVGADSINYMQEKYGITAVLRASDQFNLDVYTIWGTPWSIPYIPSKENEGVPAKSWRESSKVVILQWAARDPVRGYHDSTYSLQDYNLKGYDLSYVDYLFNIYLNNPLGNLVIGIENGGNISSFNNFYGKMLDEATKRQNQFGINFLLAKNYAQRFLNKKQVFSDGFIYLSNDFNSENQSLWVNMVNYRALIQREGEGIYLSDLRDYSSKLNEDFSILPNSQGKLWVGEKYLIDSILFPDKKKLITTASGKLKLVKDKDSTFLYSGNQKIAIFNQKNLEILTNKRFSYKFSSLVSFNPQITLVIVYFLYFILIYFITKDVRTTLKEALIVFFILILSLPFIVQKSGNDLSFLFDKKEQFLFYIFPFNKFSSINYSLTLIQTVPLLMLIPIHAFFRIFKNIRCSKYFYYLILLFYIFLYMHIFYFPLNKTSLITILIFFGSLLIVLLGLIIYLKIRSRSLLKMVSLFLFTLIFIGISVFFSRSKEIITPFEIDALQKIKNEKKDVIYISEHDYSIYPIYKAIRPLLLDNLRIASLITEVSWITVVRTESHNLKINDFKDKLIFVPRYLGSDLSDHEVKSLKLSKIFDNLQIAIYSSRK